MGITTMIKITKTSVSEHSLIAILHCSDTRTEPSLWEVVKEVVRTIFPDRALSTPKIRQQYNDNDTHMNMSWVMEG